MKQDNPGLGKPSFCDKCKKAVREESWQAINENNTLYGYHMSCYFEGKEQLSEKDRY